MSFCTLVIAGLPLQIGCSSDHSCQVPLQQFASLCTPNFDGTEADLPRCPEGVEARTIVTCGDLTSIFNASPGGSECIYDSATHHLVGANAGSDVADLCGPSFTITAGRQRDPSCKLQEGLPLPCADDATDSGVD